MAKNQVVSYSYTCDVCGGTIAESDAREASRKLSWEGTDYVLDVCESHGSQLGDLIEQLEAFVAAGQRESARRGGGRRPASSAVAAPRAARPRRAPSAPSAPSTPPPPPPPAAVASGDVAAIRAWARENGYQVNERGRIPRPVMAAYAAAMGSPAAGAGTATVGSRSGRGRKAAKG